MTITKRENIAWVEKSERLNDYYVASHRERLERGEIWINGFIDVSIIETAVMRLVTLAQSGKFEKIPVFINSGGGDVDQGFALIDVMMLSPVPVWTINVGDASSMALSIFLAGERRFAMPHSNFMAHSISYSKDTDKLGEQKSYLKYAEVKQEQLAAFYASRTKKKVNWWLTKYKEADFYFAPDEALKLGVATDIVDTPEVFAEIFESTTSEAAGE